MRSHSRQQAKKLAKNRSKKISQPRNVEVLESRMMLTTNSWKDAVSGDWGDGSKWSLGHSPTSTEDASITVDGDFNVTLSQGAAEAKSIVSSHPFTISGGTLTVQSTIQVNNTFTITAGEIDGGQIESGTGGEVLTATGTDITFYKLSLDGNVVISPSSSVHIKDNFTLKNDHAVLLDSDGSGIGSNLIFDMVGTTEFLGGSGSIAFLGSDPSSDRIKIAGGTDPNRSQSLTFSDDISVHGGGSIVIGDGIYVNLTNFGKIVSDTFNGTMSITGPGYFDNRGVVQTTNDDGNLTISTRSQNSRSGSVLAIGAGALLIDGNFANQGAMTLNGSTINLAGTFDNTGTFTRIGANGTVNLTGTWTSFAHKTTLGMPVTMSGGTFANLQLDFTAANAPIITATGATFDNVTLNGDLVLGNGLGMLVKNGLTLLNRHSITLASDGQQTDLTFDTTTQSQTLGGNGQIIFAGTKPGFNYFSVNNNSAIANALVIDRGITVHGKSGTLLTSFTPGAVGILNKGLISADLAGSSIFITGSGGFTNQGTLSVGPGKMTIDMNYSNAAGTMTAGIGGTTVGQSLGQFIVNGAFTLGGTINAVLLGGYTPATGVNFNVINYSSHSASFATTNFNAGNGIAFTAAAGSFLYTLTSNTTGPTFANRVGSVVTLTGTTGGDTISVNGGIALPPPMFAAPLLGPDATTTSDPDLLVATLNGVSVVFRNSDVTAFSLNGGEGSDTFDIRDARVENIDGGPGADTATVDYNDTYSNVETIVRGTVTGNVFKDINSNGVQEANDLGIANWTVYADTNNNGSLDVGEQSAQTDSSGNYSLANLVPGTFHIKQVFQPNYRKTLPSAGVQGYDVTVDSTQTVTGLSFGQTTNVYLAGRVFNDINANGVFDAGEAAIPNVVINIVSNNLIVATRTSDVTGFWQVKGLSNGTGEADIVLPDGYKVVAPLAEKYVGSMSSGEQNGNLNFGLQKVAAVSIFASSSTWSNVIKADFVNPLIEDLM